jgi:dipeptidyl aminopeptidase/acylaminoacyl peptidase
MKTSFPPRLLSAVLIAASLPAGLSTWAQRPVSPSGAAISPDGTTVAWTLGRGAESTLHLTSVVNPDPAKEQLIAPNGATNCSNASPVWSPDGATLAFISSCTPPQCKAPYKADNACTNKMEKPGQEEIFLWFKASGMVKQLTHLTGAIAQPEWSPDGKFIAFLFVENATRSAGATDAMKPWAGVIGEDGIEVQRVYGVRVGTGRGGWLTPADLHVYEFTWAPKFGEIAFVAAPPPGENTWWVAKLYTKRLGLLDCLGESSCSANGMDGLPQVVLDPTAVPGLLHGLQIAVPRYSPDATKIAFIGGLMSDQGSTGGDVWYVPLRQGNRDFMKPCTAAGCENAPVDITPGIDGTPCFEAWLNDKEIGFIEDRRGHTLTVDYDVVNKSEIARADLGEVTISGGPIKSSVTLSKSIEYSFVKTGYSIAPEVWVTQGDGFKQLTQLNAGVKPGPKVESIEWENEGFHVQGWLTYPENYDPARKYPLIVEVHGVPSASAGPGRGTSMWSPLGYFTLQPNPRGSFGQGEKFVQANIKDFGYGDLRDILKGMDAVEAKVSIDKGREGLTGWSYGGFMTMFAVTQTHRFKAAVAGAGISNWQSYYGENSIDQWMVPFFGATVYDDPAVYAKSSAINYIKNATTPTLVIVGDRDGECPAPQSFEFWHALRAEGVKTQLVIYPNEGHHFRDPEHTSDRDAREVKWFAENMK